MAEFRSTLRHCPARFRRHLDRLLWVLLGLVDAATLGWIWFLSDQMRQQKHIQTAMLIGSTGLLVLIWVGLFSRLRWTLRGWTLGSVLTVCLLATALFRIEGVDGDLFPIIAFRWQPARNTTLLLPMGSTRGKPHNAIDQRFALRDYPQFLGPDRNATLSGTRLDPDWAGRPPRLIWRQAIGGGWSAFAVSGRRAVTQEQRGPHELVVCYDLLTGQIQWTHRDRARYENTIAGVGPRATPTIDGFRVFTLGATGILNCLDLETGRSIWSTNLLEDNGAEMNEWGMSGSPLVVEDRIIVSAGGTNGASLVAYDKASGTRKWSAGNDRASYSSPLMAQMAGMSQVLILNHTTVAGHHPQTGRELWTYPWPGPHPKVAQPVPLPGNHLFLTSSYGVGCAVLQIHKTDGGRPAAREVWSNLKLKAKFTNVAHRDGFIYGMDEGVLVCLEVATGRRRWKSGRYGHGQLILVEDLLLIQAESGQVVLVEASPIQHRQRARFGALDTKTWNNPALAGPYLLVRNNLEAACYELPVLD